MTESPAMQPAPEGGPVRLTAAQALVRYLQARYSERDGHVNRLPVLLPSDTFANRRQGPVLRQLEHPADSDITVNDAFRPLSRYFGRIARPEQLLAVLPAADPADPATHRRPPGAQLAAAPLLASERGSPCHPRSFWRPAR